MLCCKQDIDLYSSRGSTAMYSGLPSVAATHIDNQPSLFMSCSKPALGTSSRPSETQNW